MAALLEFECPACGGGLEFTPTSQTVRCPFCDTEFTPQTIEELAKANRTASAEELHWAEPEGEQMETEHLRTYICQSCGGELICDENTAATNCPYCDNPVVMSERVEGTLQPDLIIPFKLDKQAAMDALTRHMSGKKLLPKLFRSQNRIERIQGLYVPFWLYDAQVGADIQYHATKVRHWSDANYNYTETRHFGIRRAGSVSFEAVPVDGSSKMSNDLMESIEPYDLSQAVPFNAAYLAGYLADRYDVSSSDAQPRADERIKTGTVQAFESTIHGYSSVSLDQSNLSLENSRVRYALLPVWILTTHYQGKDYTFAMNGQTGKMVGDLPVDMGAYWRWFASVAVIGTAIAYILGLVFGYGG